MPWRHRSLGKTTAQECEKSTPVDVSCSKTYLLKIPYREFKQQRTVTESGLFALFRCGFKQTFGKIGSIRVKKTLSNTNLVASRHIKSVKGSLPVDVRRSKTSLLSDTRTALKFSGVASNENY